MERVFAISAKSSRDTQCNLAESVEKIGGKTLIGEGLAWMINYVHQEYSH